MDESLKMTKLLETTGKDFNTYINHTHVKENMGIIIEKIGNLGRDLETVSKNQTEILSRRQIKRKFSNLNNMEKKGLKK